MSDFTVCVTALPGVSWQTPLIDSATLSPFVLPMASKSPHPHLKDIYINAKGKIVVLFNTKLPIITSLG